MGQRRPTMSHQRRCQPGARPDDFGSGLAATTFGSLLGLGEDVREELPQPLLTKGLRATAVLEEGRGEHGLVGRIVRIQPLHLFHDGLQRGELGTIDEGRGVEVLGDVRRAPINRDGASHKSIDNLLGDVVRDGGVLARQGKLTRAQEGDFVLHAFAAEGITPFPAGGDGLVSGKQIKELCARAIAVWIGDDRRAETGLASGLCVGIEGNHRAILREERMELRQETKERITQMTVAIGEAREGNRIVRVIEVRRHVFPHILHRDGVRVVPPLLVKKGVKDDVRLSQVVRERHPREPNRQLLHPVLLVGKHDVCGVEGDFERSLRHGGNPCSA